MNRLVIIRVGDPNLWQTSITLGRWSTPESHAQIVRDFFIEGYTVFALFVGRGDVPLGAARITGVRERILEDSEFPLTNDLGDLLTFMEFDPNHLLLQIKSHTASINYIKYRTGSQLLIPTIIATEFLSYFITRSTQPNLNVINLNSTYIVSNTNQNNINFII
jgi:hypothetical protein